MTELIVKSSNQNSRKTTLLILQEAIELKRALLNTALHRTRENLLRFERQYQMDSDHFYSLYQNGKTDDSNDYVDWAGEYQIFKNLQSHIDCLGDLVFCK